MIKVYFKRWENGLSELVALPSINNEPLKEYSLKGFFYF